MEIINIKKTIIRATSDELSKAEDDMLEQLSIRQPHESASWFPTKQEAEDWAGDVFFDAFTYYLESLGIEIEEIFK